MDFQAWQASQKFEGEEDAEEMAEEYSKKLHILTFGLDKKGTNIVAQLNGLIVFVDREFQYEVGIGDTWICKTEPGFNCAYATPLIKITLNDILNFNEQLRENVLSILWRKHGSDLKAIFENRYKAELQGKIAEELKEEYEERLARATKEKDDLESELRQTRFQLETQRFTPRSQEEDFILLGSDDNSKGPDAGMYGSCDEISLSSADVPRSPGIVNNMGVPQVQEAPRGPPQIKRAEPVTQKFEVERIGEDTIRSPSFTDNRYFVHISPDYKLLVIRPNEDGNVYCINNSIRLKDLGLVSSFTARKFLVAEYSELYEGMLVRL